MLAASVFALRRSGAERKHLQAVARQFGRVSWTAMTIALATGVAQMLLVGRDWMDRRVLEKLALVAITVIVAFVHQLTAKKSSPRVRGMVEVSTLLLSLAIFFAAVRL